MVDDLRTLRPITTLPMGDRGHVRAEGSRKRTAEDDDEPIRKKVRFLSEIVARPARSDDNNPSADVGGHEVHGDQRVPVEGVNNSSSVAAAAGGQEGPPGYAHARRISAAEKGKEALVPEDPIIEAIRRALAGGGPAIREPGQHAAAGNSSGQMPPHLKAFIKPKSEMRDKYPGKLGLHPEEPIGSDVMGYHDKMAKCSTLDFARKYCHTHPYTTQLTGTQVQVYFDRDGDPETDHMVNMWRLVRKEEAVLFAGLPERFRFIPDFRLAVELMEAERASDLDFDYIATMITEEHTGVRIEACQNVMLMQKHHDSWAVYAIDFLKKVLMVMDPVETEEPKHEMEAKHRKNAIRVLSNLRRCIHECIPGARVSSAGWVLEYNTGMHTCC